MGGQIHHQDRMSKPQCLRGVTGETTTFGPQWLVLTHWLWEEGEKYVPDEAWIQSHSPGPVAGAVTRTLALVLRRDTRALGADGNEKNKREQILALSSWRRGYRVFV